MTATNLRKAWMLPVLLALCPFILPAQGAGAGNSPPAKQGAPEVKELLRRELQRSKPDYVAYQPGHYNGSTDDSLNEHFLVFDGPDGSLMAVWTQSSCRNDVLEGAGPQINRIVFSRSTDEGVTWSKPVRVAGPAGKEQPPYMASWGFPMVSKTGRIYVLWNQHQGRSGWNAMHCGTMSGCYSDDQGKTWSPPQNIPMKRSPYDDPTSDLPSEWIVWQVPMRDLHGGYFVGFTRWVNRNVAKMKDCPSWPFWESVCEFMRFPNVDENPEPRDLRIVNCAWGDKALKVPFYRDPLMTVAQEPSLVRLPDQRLFCVMRTTTGCIWYSTSADDGDTWADTRPLLRKDHGSPIPQPLSCCPIYPLADGRFVLLHHNNSENLTAPLNRAYGPRWPAYIALAEFRPDAQQPLWFSESKELMSNDGCNIEGRKAPPSGGADRINNNIGVYSSFTNHKGNDVLWHPERKFFLLGKKITKEFLAELHVPSATAPVLKPLSARVQSLSQVAEEKAAWGSLRWLMNSKLEPQSGVTFGIVELNVGQSNPLHTHPNSDEVIYVLSGKCEQRVGNETVVLNPGDTLRVPAGVPHQAKVIGNEPMRAIVAYNTGERQFAPVKE